MKKITSEEMAKMVREAMEFYWVEAVENDDCNAIPPIDIGENLLPTMDKAGNMTNNEGFVIETENAKFRIVVTRL